MGLKESSQQFIDALKSELQDLRKGLDAARQQRLRLGLQLEELRLDVDDLRNDSIPAEPPDSGLPPEPRLLVPGSLAFKPDMGKDLYGYSGFEGEIGPTDQVRPNWVVDGPTGEFIATSGNVLDKEIRQYPYLTKRVNLPLVTSLHIQASGELHLFSPGEGWGSLLTHAWNFNGWWNTFTLGLQSGSFYVAHTDADGEYGKLSPGQYHHVVVYVEAASSPSRIRIAIWVDGERIFWDRKSNAPTTDYLDAFHAGLYCEGAGKWSVKNHHHRIWTLDSPLEDVSECPVA